MVKAVERGARGSPARAAWRVLALRKTRDLCLGHVLWAVLTAQQGVLFLLERSALLSLDRNGLMVVLHPAALGLLAAVVLLITFSVVYAAADPARERESGALETLFYGPVSSGAYILAEAAAIAVAALLSLALLLAALAIGRVAVGWDLPAAVFALAGLALLAVLATVAAALCGAAFFRQVRLATVASAALLLLSIAAFTGDYLLARYESGGSFFALFLRAALDRTNSVLRFVFPLGLFLDDLIRFEGTGAVPALHLAYYPAYTATLLAAAAFALRRRGVTAR